VPWLRRSKVKVARSRHPPDRCWPVSREGNVLEIPKLLGRLPTPQAIMRTSFKVKVTRLTNAEIGNASYLLNRKAYELQTWYVDGVRRPVSPTSTLTFKVKGQGRNVTRCVWQVLAQKSRMQSVRNTETGRKVAHPTGNIAHLFQGQKVKGQGQQGDRKCIISMEREGLWTSKLVRR